MACVAIAAPAGSALGAAPTGAYATFLDCPYENLEVKQCDYIEMIGGEVRVGGIRISLTHKLLLQGGSTLNFETGQERFYGARDGETLSKVSEPVTGVSGLAGVVAVIELVRPASEIAIDGTNLEAGEGEVVGLPVRMRLENGLLGSACFIGSSSSPIHLDLTAGRTSPPPPNSPISGAAGNFVFVEEGAIMRDTGYRLVDNAFAVPVASGCGGSLSSLVDPWLDAKVGLPSAAGRNTAILTGNLMRAYAPTVRDSVR